mmetsp:Transcript_44972/g.140859  ORF Transcript_44972/g.140859 Transcript_44972/m.140859 type:complete len:283 (+) Transcript_44972:311-1159(+)
MPEYGRKKYWEDRYAGEDEGFDWLWGYDSVRSNLRLFMKPTDRILIVGCGNADFSVDVFKDGYTNCVNIDTSEVVIQQMSERYPQQEWRVMDVLDMDFEDDEFDVVLDKSLIDTLLCYENSVRRVSEMVQEIRRVTKPGGRYISMSLHSPEEILAYFSSKYTLAPSPVDPSIDDVHERIPPPEDWQVQHCRLRNPRWNLREGSERAVAHTFVVCTVDHPGGYAPIDFVDDISEDEMKRMGLEAAAAKEDALKPKALKEATVDEMLQYLDSALEARLGSAKLR